MSDCNFDKAWIGKCKKECDDKFCTEHQKVKCCVCGSQAVGECDHTGQFVCGFPLCENCEGFTDQSKKSGAWGFLNHSHRAKVQP